MTSLPIKAVARPTLPWTFLLSLFIHLLILFLVPAWQPGLPGGVPGARYGYAVGVLYLGELGTGGEGGEAGAPGTSKGVTELVSPGQPEAEKAASSLPNRPEMQPKSEVLTSPAGKIKIQTPVEAEKKNPPAPAKEGSGKTGEGGTGGIGQAPVAPPGQSLVVFGQPPVYPKNAANEGVEGTVELVVWVTAQGEAVRVDLAKSSGDSRLDLIAQRTVAQSWRFKPEAKDYRLVLRVEFKGGETQVIYGPVTLGVNLPAKEKTGE